MRRTVEGAWVLVSCPDLENHMGRSSHPLDIQSGVEGKIWAGDAICASLLYQCSKSMNPNEIVYYT